MLILKSTEGLKVRMRPRYRGGKCKDCIKGRRPIKDCGPGPNVKCLEQIQVYKTLNPTGQRMYWVLRQLTENGGKKVAIRDVDMAELVNTTTRTLFINSKILVAWGMIKTEILSHAGKEIASPRKCYTFIGVDGNE